MNRSVKLYRKSEIGSELKQTGYKVNVVNVNLCQLICILIQS